MKKLNSISRTPVFSRRPIRSIAMLATLMPMGVSAEPLAERQFEEVVVTASYLPIAPARSGNAITVIDRETLENRSPLAVTEVLRDVPGIAVSRNGMLGSSTQLRVRGAEANQLLVLIDGVEANDPSQGDEFNWGTLTADQIERIEVVRGPQSALQGSDAMAGVINIITRSAESPYQVSLSSEAGSFGTRRLGASLGHKGEKFDIRLGISDLDSDGENISRAGDEKDGYENTTINLKGGWQLSESLRLGFSGRQHEGRNEFDAVDSVVTGLPADAPLVSEFRNRTAQVQLDYGLFDGAWQHSLMYALTENDNESFDGGISSGDTQSEKNQYRYLSSLLWADGSQRLTFLAEREEEDFSQRGPVSFGLDPDQDRERETDSLALEYRGTFMERLTLAASIRHDDNSRFDDADTERLEASYQVLPATRLRAAWGTAVKNPTFTELFGFYPSTFLGNPALQPEESESWELGLDQQLLDHRLDLSLTWFQAELENEIDGFVFDPATFLFTARNLSGTSRRQGVEASLRARLTSTLTLDAAYTYTDATEEDRATGDRVDELRRPRHTGSVTLAWQATPALQLNANAQYTGDQRDRFFPPFPQPSRLVEMNAYTLVNLNANFSVTDNLGLYLRLQNALNEDYEEVYGYQTPDFGAFAGVRWRFAR